MRLTDFLTESINDKALLKAVFLVGPPGGGKTTISQLVSDGSLPITSISSDIWTEFFADHKGREDWADIETDVKRFTISNIVNKLNGLLPVFVDTTAADLGDFHRRVDVLEDMGYDISMVIIDVKVETSVFRVLQRNQKIKRQVPTDFAKKAHKLIYKAVPAFKQRIPDNMTINNDVMNDAVIRRAYKQVTKFFNTPVKNAKGQKLLDYMRENGHKYYDEVPSNWKAKNGFPEAKNTAKWFKSK